MNVHERNPEMSGKLANLMAHNEATASKYYLLYEKAKASAEASQHLSRLMRADYIIPILQNIIPILQNIIPIPTSAETEGADSESSNNNGDTRI